MTMESQTCTQGDMRADQQREAIQSTCHVRSHARSRRTKYFQPQVKCLHMAHSTAHQRPQPAYARAAPCTTTRVTAEKLPSSYDAQASEGGRSRYGSSSAREGLGPLSLGHLSLSASPSPACACASGSSRLAATPALAPQIPNA